MTSIVAFNNDNLFGIMAISATTGSPETDEKRFYNFIEAVFQGAGIINMRLCKIFGGDTRTNILHHASPDGKIYVRVGGEQQF